MTDKEMTMERIRTAICGYDHCERWNCPLKDSLGCRQFDLSYEELISAYSRTLSTNIHFMETESRRHPDLVRKYGVRYN